MSITCHLLSPRGYCSGVSRAVNMANQVAKLYGTFYATEDIVHNKTFTKQLEQKGMKKVDSIDDIPDGSTVMFSAHGISPQIAKKAENKELTIIDATCPVVKSIQNDAKECAEHGKTIIIIGNKAHAEIVALTGYVNNAKFYVVYNENEIDLLPDLNETEVVYFSQTTLDNLFVDEIIEKLKSKFPKIKAGSNSGVCYATKERQNVVRAIASSVDLIVVVGSIHSSNAKRLVEVALNSGAKNAVLVDSKNEFNDNWMNEVKSIAITSAASTSEDLVQELLEYLKNKFEIEIREFQLQNEKN